MMDDDEPIEVPSPPSMTVPETHRLFRLVPAVVDYLKQSMQTALVPADNEDDARRIATLRGNVKIGRDGSAEVAHDFNPSGSCRSGATWRWTKSSSHVGTSS